MPYIKVTYTAGVTVEVDKHYSARYGRRSIRSPNRRNTPENQCKVNERRAEDNLRRIINTNFGVGDIHMTLGYSRKFHPTLAEARRDKERFTRKYREWCHRQGIKPRYIAVTEHKGHRIHHHFVIGEIPSKVLYELWPFGRPHLVPLDATGNYAQLASYLIKETAQTFREEESVAGKRWTQSKGLKKPLIKREIVQANSWCRDPRPAKGYRLLKDTLRSGFHEVNGYGWQRYIMIKDWPVPKNRRRTVPLALLRCSQAKNTVLTGGAKT